MFGSGFLLHFSVLFFVLSFSPAVSLTSMGWPFYALFFAFIVLLLISIYKWRTAKIHFEDDRRLGAVFENMQDGFYRADNNGTILWGSPSAARMLGYDSGDELLGRQLSELYINPEERKKLLEEMKLNGRVKEYEIRLKRRDGGVLIASVSSSYWRDENGNILGLEGIFRDITERKRAEEALRESEEKYRTLLETANSLIICLDPKARITVFNDEIERITGYRREEVIGKSWPDIFLPKDHYHHKIHNFAEWVRKHPKDRLEGQIITKSGEIKTILWSNSVIFHSGSDDFTAVAVGHDISDRKVAENALKESETRLNDALKYSLDILYRLNLMDDTYDYMSSSVYSITGYTSDEAIAMGPKGVNALTHPDDLDLIENYRDKIIRLDSPKNVPHNIEYRIRCKNGKYVWLSDSHVLVRDSDGRPKFLIGAARDITERKNAEEELKESEHRYALSTSAARVGVWDWNIQTGDFYLDPSVKAALGYTDDEIPNNLEIWSEYIHPDDRKEVMDAAQAHIEGKTPEYVSEYRMLHKDGTVRWMHTQGLAIRDSENKVIRFIGTDTDITERKVAEEALARSEKNLRALFENYPDFILIIDENGIIKYLNRSRSILTVEEIVGRKILYFSSDEHHPKIMEAIRKATVYGESSRFEFSGPGQDGLIYWYDAIMGPLLREGKTHDVVMFLSSITAIKHAELRQKARFELLNNLRTAEDIDVCLNFGCKSIFDAGLYERAVMTLHDRNREIINIGFIGLDESVVKAARIAPAPDENLTEKMMQEKFRLSNSYFIPEEAALSLEKSPRYISQRQYTKYDNSSWQSADELFVPLLDSSGVVEGWLSVDTPLNKKRPNLEEIRLLEETVDVVMQKIREIRTIINLKRERRALQESESRFRALFEGAAEGILVADIDTRKFKYANPAICRMLGYSKDELERMGVEDIHPKNSRENALDQFGLLTRNEKSAVLDMPCLRKDGSIIYVDISAAKTHIDNKEHGVGFFADITERKKIMNALMKSEEFNRAVIEHSPIGVSVRSRTSKLLTCNKTWQNIWAYTDHEIQAFLEEDRAEVDLSHPRNDYLGNWRPEVERIYREGGRLYVPNVRVPKPRGRDSLWISQYFYAIKDIHGNVDRVVILTEDITERKKAIDSLTKSEEFSRAVIERSPIGVSVRNRYGKLLSYNDTWVKIWRFSEEDMIDFTTRERTELKLDHRDDYLRKWHSELKRVYTEGGYLHIPDVEIRNPNKKGSLWITQHFYAIKDDQGDVERVVILTEDITERKIAEEAIQENERKFRAIVEHSLQAMFIVQEGKFIFCNQKFAEIMEMSVDELIGMQLMDFFEYIADPETRQMMIDNYQFRAAGSQSEKHYEILMKTPRKTERWIELMVNSVIHDGKPAIQGSFLDITERRRAEDKVKMANRERLEQAKRIAGTFAHEIRNALFPAIASLNKMKVGAMDKDESAINIEKYSRIAEQAITRAADLTRLISVYKKLDSEIMPERVDIGPVIDELINNNQLRLREAGVTLDISGGQDRLVKSNRKQLLLALNNLLLNSIEALTGTENPRININWSLNEEYHNITFKDNGCGISRDHLDRIFEPFFSMKSESGGTGLGLAMTKRIVEMYGGKISVNSQPGKGAQFDIELRSFRED